MAAVTLACGLLLTGARAGADPSPVFAGRSRVFGLVEAGSAPGELLFAPARKVQPGGPETVRPAAIGRYVRLTLAPGVVIRASAPIVENGVTDWVRGVRLTPEQLTGRLRDLRLRTADAHRQNSGDGKHMKTRHETPSKAGNRERAA